VPFELFLFASGAAVFAIDYRTFAAIGGALVGAVHSAARSKSCA